MPKSKRQHKASPADHFDLFRSENLSRPAPATLSGRMLEKIRRQQLQRPPEPKPVVDQSGLPDVEELYRRYDQFNVSYFAGKLPRVKIEYSNRMSTAGSYTPSMRLIRIGRKYHELFPQDVDDTLKHEMIHIRHFNHDAKFKAEAERIGCSLLARPHPALHRPARYLYVCPACGTEYPRQKRLRMASCGDCSFRGQFDSRFKLQLRESRHKKR